MTAKTKKGYHGHGTHGADHGTAHKRLMTQHTEGSARPEGAMLPPQQAAPPMMGGGAPAMGPPGASGGDDESGDQT